MFNFCSCSVGVLQRQITERSVSVVVPFLKEACGVFHAVILMLFTSGRIVPGNRDVCLHMLLEMVVLFFPQLESDVARQL